MATHASKFAHVLAIVNPHAIKILMSSNLDSGEFVPDASQMQGEVRSEALTPRIGTLQTTRKSQISGLSLHFSFLGGKSGKYSATA